MARDAKIMAAAYRRQQQDRESRRREQERREQEVHSRVPRIAQIDQELRSTASRLVLAAFEAEGDPEAELLELKNVNLSLQRERAELLVGHGWPLDYLDGAPQCAQCQDSGYLRDGTPCRCLNVYYTQEQNRRLSKLLDLGNQSFETFSFEWYSPNIWPEYGRSPLENMRMVRAICEEYAHAFGPYSGNLFFTGAPGLGKTFLSACIARKVSERGFSVVYDTANHVFQQFESAKFGHDNPYEEDPDREINRYLNCDLLIMDDLGTELRSNFIQSVFYRIVNDRLLSRRKTVLSTNLAVSELGDRYGEAVRSRIEGEYQALWFFGDDIRVLKRDRS